jgi:SAM-dependent methyltransferase
MPLEPAAYDAWYYTPRGRWIGRREFSLLRQLLQPVTGTSLLEVGCGTGYFSRRFARAGLQVTGSDPDPAMLDFARQQDGRIEYLQADARRLPFAAGSFDYCAAITSLCFISEPSLALSEMWRVSRRGVVLGVLNRRSMLHLQKLHCSGYAGARWDDRSAVHDWVRELTPTPIRVRFQTAVLFPGGGILGRGLEPLLAPWLPWGGFLCVGLVKSGH